MGPSAVHPFSIDAPGLSGLVRRAGVFQCISVRIADAVKMQPLDLQHATVEAYRALRPVLNEGPTHPVRLWNYIPSINEAFDERTDRYMVFNAGRHAAYMECYKHCGLLDGDIPTASGVGHDGLDLFIHCLAADRPGIAVENPRQIPAYRYSQRYGPFPPSFTRATILPAGNPDDDDHLFIGGTASICGENSLHLTNLQRQTRETLHNLASVVKTAWSMRDGSGGEVNGNVNGDLGYWLSLLREVRVYHVHDEHRAHLEVMLGEHFKREQVQWVRADLCRPELLVEIEAIADLPRTIPMQLHHAALGSTA